MSWQCWKQGSTLKSIIVTENEKEACPWIGPIVLIPRRAIRVSIRLKSLLGCFILSWKFVFSACKVSHSSDYILDQSMGNTELCNFCKRLLKVLIQEESFYLQIGFPRPTQFWHHMRDSSQRNCGEDNFITLYIRRWQAYCSQGPQACGRKSLLRLHWGDTPVSQVIFFSLFPAPVTVLSVSPSALQASLFSPLQSSHCRDREKTEHS